MQKQYELTQFAKDNGWVSIDEVQSHKDFQLYNYYDVVFSNGNTDNTRITSLDRCKENGIVGIRISEPPLSPLVQVVNPTRRLAHGRLYFYVNCFGEVGYSTDWAGDRDNKLYASGNYFQTEEHAKESEIYASYLTN